MVGNYTYNRKKDVTVTYILFVHLKSGPFSVTLQNCCSLLMMKTMFANLYQ